MVVLILAVLGLVLGSFVNALVWRLHQQTQVKSHKAKKQLSITTGHSMCPNCQHRLGMTDLVPVLSWLWLRGKCRYCHQPIGWHYPIVELTTALLFIFSYSFWPMKFHGSGQFEFILWLMFLIGFVALAVYDMVWSILPNKIVYPLIGLGLVQLVGMSVFYHGGFSLVLGVFWGVIISSGLFYLLFQLSKGSWIGGGDVKLGLVIGLIIGGPLDSLLMLFLASAMGSLCSIPLLLSHRAKTTSRLPFGPFLIVATILVRLFGTGLISWYKRQYF